MPKRPTANTSSRSKSKRPALNDIDAITAIDGVDLVFVGPADLSQSLGIQGQRSHQKIWDALEAVASACKRHGKHWGIVPVDPAFAQRTYDMGCRMITFGNDINALKTGIAAIKQAYSGLFG
ncbi:MAG: aldolase/citrate lyase family protein [Pirellulales bacterium]